MNLSIIIALQLLVFALLVLKMWRQTKVTFSRICWVLCVSIFALMSVVTIPEIRLALEAWQPNVSLPIHNGSLMMALSVALAEAINHRTTSARLAATIGVTLSGLILLLLGWVYITEMRYLPQSSDWTQLVSPWGEITLRSLLFAVSVLGYSAVVCGTLATHHWELLQGEADYAIRVRQSASWLSSLSLSVVFLTLLVKLSFTVRQIVVPVAPFTTTIQVAAILALSSFSLHVFPRRISRAVVGFLANIFRIWDLIRLQPLVHRIEKCVTLPSPDLALNIAPHEQLCRRVIYILDAKVLLESRRDEPAQALLDDLNNILGDVEESEVVQVVFRCKQISKGAGRRASFFAGTLRRV